MWRVIGELREAHGLTVLLTTHYMEETEDADHVLIIDRGRDVASGTPMELRSAHSRPRLSLSLPPTAEDALRSAVQSQLGHLGDEFAAEPVAEGGAFHLRVPDSEAALGIVDAVRETAPGALTDFEFRHGSMQDVFLAVTDPENGVNGEAA
ncbi:MAG TPA: hypothetical protein GX743_07760 [Actinomycetales bacterium]|nr:hypothetical protein [Actinomycetales bacterium]